MPFHFGEIPEKLRSRQILEGSYPELLTREFAGAREWYAAYISNYIERDVRSLFNVGSLKDFRRLILLLAGPVFENYCLAEILKNVLHSGADISLYYLRSNSGLETDIIIQERDRNKTLYLEVKNTATARFRMIKPLKN